MSHTLIGVYLQSQPIIYMKKRILKVLLALVVVLVVGVGILLAYVKTALPDVGPAPELTVKPTPELLARGQYLANHVMVCMDCHGTRDYTRFSGPMVPGSQGIGGENFDHRFGFPGSFTAKNITPFNLGNWTDGELFRVITTGVTKDGKALFPVMPYKYYGQLDEQDIYAVIAYLRSLPAIKSDVPPSKADFPFNFIVNTIPQKADLQQRPPETDIIAYGKYMATASGCMECHTKQEKGKMIGEPFAGGFRFDLGNGSAVTSSNITPHTTGIGNWSREQFIRRFKMYADSGYIAQPVDMVQGEFQTVMPWTMYAGMEEDDLGAIYEYLRTITPADNVVKRFSRNGK